MLRGMAALAQANGHERCKVRPDLLFERHAIQLRKPPHRIFTHMIGRIPGRMIVEECKPRIWIGCKLGVVLDLSLEFSLQLRIFYHHFAGEFFEYVWLAVFLLLKNSV